MRLDDVPAVRLENLPKRKGHSDIDEKYFIDHLVPFTTVHIDH